MGNLENLLLKEYELLQEKMYKCKTIHIRYDMKEDHVFFLLKLSVLGVYATWEGFLKKSIALYLQEINREKLAYSDLNEYYIAYQTDQIVKFKSSKTSFNVIRKTSAELHQMYQKDVVFSTNVNTESNANLKVANAILEKLRLSSLDSKFEKRLDRLLFFRNSIAHGDDGVPVEQNDLDSFTLLIQELASNIVTSIIDGFQKKVYRR